MKTRQETFNEVVAGLAAQGFERSVKAGSVTPQNPPCMYRGAYGRKCAVGVLLPDDSPPGVLKFEGTVGDLYERCYDLPLFEDHDLALLRHLQVAHDGRAGDDKTPDAMRDRLRGVARHFDLEIPEVLKVEEV